MKNDPIAHIAGDGREHPLKEHLEGTANLSSAFATEFGNGGWGYLAGLWHDLGKHFFFCLLINQNIKERVDHNGGKIIRSVT